MNVQALIINSVHTQWNFVSILVYAGQNPDHRQISFLEKARDAEWASLSAWVTCLDGASLYGRYFKPDLWCSLWPGDSLRKTGSLRVPSLVATLYLIPPWCSLWPDGSLRKTGSLRVPSLVATLYLIPPWCSLWPDGSLRKTGSLRVPSLVATLYLIPSWRDVISFILNVFRPDGRYGPATTLPVEPPPLHTAVRFLYSFLRGSVKNLAQLAHPAGVFPFGQARNLPNPLTGILPRKMALIECSVHDQTLQILCQFFRGLKVFGVDDSGVGKKRAVVRVSKHDGDHVTVQGADQLFGDIILAKAETSWEKWRKKAHIMVTAPVSSTARACGQGGPRGHGPRLS